MENNKEKDAAIIRQLNTTARIFAGGRNIQIPEGRGKILFAKRGEVTFVKAGGAGIEDIRSFQDSEIGVYMQKLENTPKADNEIRLTEYCSNYLKAIYEATSLGHADQSREVGYNYCLLVPDRMESEDQMGYIVENKTGILESHPIEGEDVNAYIYGVAYQRAMFDYANKYAENPVMCLAEDTVQDQ